jgi:hypothetical protein
MERSGESHRVLSIPPPWPHVAWRLLEEMGFCSLRVQTNRSSAAAVPGRDLVIG